MGEKKLMRSKDPKRPYPGREWYGDRWCTPEQIARKKAADRDKDSRAGQAAVERREQREQRRLQTINAAVRVDEAGVSIADEARIRWVAEHLFDDPLPKAPDAATAGMLKLALLDRRAWADRYFAPMVVKLRQDEADIEGERQDREVKKLALEWLERRKFVPCPACGGEGAFNGKYAYSVAPVQDLTEGGGI